MVFSAAALLLAALPGLIMGQFLATDNIEIATYAHPGLLCCWPPAVKQWAETVSKAI